MEAGLGLSQPIQTVEPVDKPTRQHIINRYHKIYVRRNPPRQQVRWRPITVDRKDQPSSEELPEVCRSGTIVWVGDIQATEEADRNGRQSQSQKMGAYWTVEEAIGGAKVTGSGGKAKSEADRADEGSTAYIGGIGGVG
jgi:hypothetical protein